MMRSPQGWAPTDTAAGASHRSVARRRWVAGAAITAIVGAALAAGTIAPASASPATGAPPGIGAVTAVAPDKPVIPNAIAGPYSALVRWTAPADGGSPITEYTVRVWRADLGVQFGALRSVAATPNTSSNSLNVTGLLREVAFRFQVQATNAVGTSALSNFSNRIIPISTPGKTVIERANPGVRGGAITARANWMPPRRCISVCSDVIDGGSAINGYQVTAMRLSATGRVMSSRTSVVQHFSARSLSMTLLTGNYRFVVRARNKLGYGVYSSRSTLVTAR